jgi:hypothetical protein
MFRIGALNEVVKDTLARYNLQIEINSFRQLRLKVVLSIFHIYSNKK